jgi:hypothetical protein
MKKADLGVNKSNKALNRTNKKRHQRNNNPKAIGTQRSRKELKIKSP